MAARILLIDDDRKLCRLIGEYLGPLGYEKPRAAAAPTQTFSRRVQSEYGRAERPPPMRPEDHGPRPAQRRPEWLRAGKPPRYWILFPIAPKEEIRRGPVTPVMRSDSRSAGGLLFDPKPWLFAGGGVLVLSVLFRLPLVRGITRSISEMTSITSQIAAGNSEVHAPEDRQDELGTLGKSINQMAGRLSGFIQGQKRFLGDTAHELVSPLARMEMVLSILEQRSRIGDYAPEWARGSAADV